MSLIRQVKTVNRKFSPVNPGGFFHVNSHFKILKKTLRNINKLEYLESNDTFPGFLLLAIASQTA